MTLPFGFSTAHVRKPVPAIIAQDKMWIVGMNGCRRCYKSREGSTCLGRDQHQLCGLGSTQQISCVLQGPRPCIFLCVCISSVSFEQPTEDDVHCFGACCVPFKSFKSMSIYRLLLMRLQKHCCLRCFCQCVFSPDKRKLHTWDHTGKDPFCKFAAFILQPGNALLCFVLASCGTLVAHWSKSSMD